VAFTHHPSKGLALNVQRLSLPLLAALVAACTTTPIETPPPATTATAASAVTPVTVGAPSATPGSTGAGTVQGSALPGTRSVSGASLDDPNSMLAKRDTYFDFDSFDVRQEYTPMLEAHARFASANRTARVRIEGHADERGSREYNLALGQKRAEATRKALVVLGAPEAALEATSFGEEKPADPGHDEAAWAKNRRAHLDYVTR
jgi:peptidoglycan-associated lipoprotein